MALQIWLPLTNDLTNYGLRQDITFAVQNDSGALSYNSQGKMGGCYERTVLNAADHIRSSSTIFLDGDFSMCCWALVSEHANTNSAQGLITNHSHEVYAGSGITMRYISNADYRISCNTGTGSSRTYCTYAGSTNIYNSWHHLGLTYNSAAHQLRMYVDGKLETISAYDDKGNVTAVLGTTLNYALAATHTYFDLFNWSTTWAHNSSYRPKCKLNDVRVYDHCLSPREMHTISQGLILHYKLHGFPTDIEYDCAGFGVKGTRHGTLVSENNSARNEQALLFTDGRTNYIASETIAAPKNAITMSCWIKGKEAGYKDYHIPLCFNSSQYEMSINARGKFRSGFVIIDSSGSSTRKCVDSTHSGSILDDKWHMLTLTYNGAAIMRYVDGVEVPIADENTYKYCAGSLSGASGQWYIGNYSNSGGYGNKNLSMSDVRIYSRALSNTEIRELYNTSISLTQDGVLFEHELKEENINPSFAQTGVVKAQTITTMRNLHGMPVKLLSDGSAWARIHWIDFSISQDYFTTAQVQECTNQSNRFSLMKYIDNFKTANGVYEFMLTYPQHNTKGKLYNRWRQTNSPNAAWNTGTGYEAVGTQAFSSYLAPLTKCNSSGSAVYCTNYSGNWWAPIGQLTLYNKKGIPAADGSTQLETELWVRIDNIPNNIKMQIFKDCLQSTNFIEW